MIMVIVSDLPRYDALSPHLSRDSVLAWQHAAVELVYNNYYSSRLVYIANNRIIHHHDQAKGSALQLRARRFVGRGDQPSRRRDFYPRDFIQAVKSEGEEFMVHVLLIMCLTI